jgi:hypothetical protein
LYASFDEDLGSGGCDTAFASDRIPLESLEPEAPRALVAGSRSAPFEGSAVLNAVLYHFVHKEFHSSGVAPIHAASRSASPATRLTPEVYGIG